jgi:protein SCO1/2/putative membrane protein
VAAVYYAILASHVLLAMTVPVLASVTIWHGLRDNRATHRRLARVTFPVWLYVSVTGVIIYWMLYRLE